MLNTEYDFVENILIGNHHITDSSQEPPSTHDNNEMPPISIAAEVIRSHLHKFNPYKETGPENLRPCVLRELANVLARPLAALFQSSHDHATVPEGWKIARVTILYKKREIYLPSTYCPINLTCATCKFMGHAHRDQPNYPVPRGN